MKNNWSITVDLSEPYVPYFRMDGDRRVLYKCFAAPALLTALARLYKMLQKYPDRKNFDIVIRRLNVK